MRRKGELSPAGVDRGWPHQVAMRQSLATGKNFNIIHAFCKDLSICPRGHFVFYENEFWQVFCFEKLEDADKLIQRFGGERFDPKQRGKGADWARWNKS